MVRPPRPPTAPVVHAAGDQLPPDRARHRRSETRPQPRLTGRGPVQLALVDPLDPRQQVEAQDQTPSPTSARFTPEANDVTKPKTRGFRRAGPNKAGQDRYNIGPDLRFPVELRGLEPLTPTLPVWCATSCAIAPDFTLGDVLRVLERSYTTPRCGTKSPAQKAGGTHVRTIDSNACSMAESFRR